MGNIDWPALRAAATEVMGRAYAPYSKFPVGAAGLVDDGRVVTGCNVENAAYGVVLCAECGVVSALHASGGGRLVALSCVDVDGEPLMPCGRCRQLLWEHGGPQCLVDADPRPRSMAELLPHAFDVTDLDARDMKPVGMAPSRRFHAVQTEPHAPVLPPSLAEWQGRGTVFIHADMAGGQRIWTGYWERSTTPDEPAGILEEAPNWATAAEGAAWGRLRTPRVVVVNADGTTAWAGAGDPPAGMPRFDSPAPQPSGPTPGEE
jgi:cytidine deaminase